MKKNKVLELFEKHNPFTAMEEEAAAAMINILMSGEETFSLDIEKLDKKSEIHKQFKPLIEAFQVQVFLKRLKFLAKLKINLGALLIMAHHFSTPGDAVMYAFYFNHKVPANTVITLETISNIFPMGFFSEEQLHAIWDGQKCERNENNSSDNLIDNNIYWERN